MRVTEDELVIYDQAFVEAARHRALPADRRGTAQPSARTTSRPATPSGERSS